MSDTSTSTSSSGHPVADPAAWRAARLQHLEREKAFTRERDALSEERRRLPWLEISAAYTFEGPDGPATLGELFGDQPQLLVYHFMMGPGWVEGCPSCSFWADNYDGTQVHLAHRNTSLVAISRAPLDEITAYKDRMGWSFAWYSSAGSSFNYDMGVSFRPDELDRDDLYNFGTQGFGGEEAPGISTFIKDDDGRIFLTYQTFARGLDMANGTYHMLDFTAMGRDEDGLDWSMQWLHRHDAYPD